jgi:hypothetical protein
MDGKYAMRNLYLLTLHVQLAVMRWGVVNGIAAIICIAAAVGWLWGMPQLRTRLEDQKSALSSTRALLRQTNTPASAPQRSLAEERLANFYDTLGEKQYAEQQIKTLFAIAAKTNLILNLADYKLALNKDGHYTTYQISLPVKGAYTSIRQFCEQVLLAIPFASLDDISFKREAIANRNLEAKLQFTLYLTAPEMPQTLPPISLNRAQKLPPLQAEVHPQVGRVSTTPSPSRGRLGWGWVSENESTRIETHPHPNPPLEGEGTDRSQLPQTALLSLKDTVQ